MSLGECVVQARAFFKFISVHWIAAKEFPRRFAALRAQIVQFKNQFDRLADRNFYVHLSFMHEQTIGFSGGARHVQNADCLVGVCLTKATKAEISKFQHPTFIEIPGSKLPWQHAKGEFTARRRRNRLLPQYRSGSGKSA